MNKRTTDSYFHFGGGFRLESDKSVMVKVHGKKLRLLIEWHITPITCRLELAFFFAQIRNNRCMSCLRNAIESKTA